MTNPTDDKSTTNPSKARLSAGLRPLSDSELAGDSEFAGDSELSLEDRVRLSFEQLAYPQLNAVQCTVEGDQMRLTGVLNSFYLKQVAQSVAVKIPGVRSVLNEIEVH